MQRPGWPFLALALAACTHDSTAAHETVVNVWSGAVIDVTHLPLGDALIATSAQRGHLFVCPSDSPPGPPVGASAPGPWIDLANQTWDLTKKLSVQGARTWPAATYGESVSSSTRTLVTNGLPVKTVTGNFPISPTDPVYRYDTNPSSIAEVALRYVLPTSPASAAPSCVPMGPIGLLRNGVAIFAPVDEQRRDAVAWETQDSCQGHPQQLGEYHYHDVSACLRDAALGPSTVIGWAADGFPIVIERDASGALPTNADLDDCHGRDAPYLLDGKVVSGYHYAATLEFPYTIGCFRAAPVAASRIDR
jgi:hypothetical protein